MYTLLDPSTFVTFITGATSGFGAAAARRYVAAGGKVIATGRRTERLEELQAELGADNCHIITLDIRDRAAIDAAIAAIPAPFAGINISPFAAVVIAFLLNNSSYYAEVYRAGLISVAKGQWEAAQSTGLSTVQTLAHVVLPQAIRNVLPDLLSNTVEVVKLTSLASVISLSELLYNAGMARSVTYNASPLVLAALIYLVLLWPLVRLVSHFQRRLAA